MSRSFGIYVILFIILGSVIICFFPQWEETAGQDLSVPHSSKIGSLVTMKSNIIQVKINEVKEFQATVYIRNGSMLDNKEVIIEVSIDSPLPITAEYPHVTYVDNEGFGKQNISFQIDYTSEDIESGRYSCTININLLYSINGSVFQDSYEFHDTIILESVPSSELLWWAEAGVGLNWALFTLLPIFLRERIRGIKNSIGKIISVLAISFALSLVVFLQFLKEFQGGTYAISVLSALGIGFFWHAGFEGMGKKLYEALGGTKSKEKKP